MRLWAHHSALRRKLGFSLLELAVVIAIISLIAGAGMGMARGALQAADRISTQEKLAAIQLALDSHAKTYGYLPCPAARTLRPNADPTFGVENRNASVPGNNTCTAVGSGGIVSISSIYIGGVPVRTLGLPDNYASDAWGNKLTYAVSANMVTNPASAATSNGSITVNYGPIPGTYSVTTERKSDTYTNTNNGGAEITTGAPTSITAGTIVHLKSNVATGYAGSYYVKATGSTFLLTTDAALTTNLAYNAADTGGTLTWQSPGAGASYVVVSHGPDGKGAFPTEGSAVATACDLTPAAGEAIDNENCDDTNAVFYDAAYNDGSIATEFFDDYIVWGSNALQRAAVNDALYTNGTTSTCPTDVCEAWCAACTTNYPGAVATVPPTATLNATTIPAAITLCRKVVVSNASTCTANCFWGGVNEAAGPTYTYYKCP